MVETFKKEVLLYSGGLDSFIAWYYLGKPGRLYCSLGHRYESAELKAIGGDGILDGVFVLDRSLNLGKWEKKDAHIPLRNAFLVQTAALYLDEEGGTVHIVIQEDEMSIPDRTIEFMDTMTELLTFLLQKPVKVSTPFAKMDKTDMVAWYVKNSLPLDKLIKTWSCYASPGKDALPCGECSACFRRWVAMSLNYVTEKYMIPPYASKVAKEYLDKAHSGYYSDKRNNRIIDAMRKKFV